MSVRFAWLADLAWLAAALACLAPTPAIACDAVASAVKTTVRLDYDPFAFAPTAGDLVIEVENREASACDIDLVLLGADRVPIGDRDVDGTGVVATFASSDPELVPTASAGVWRAHLQSNERTRYVIAVRITHDAVASAGEHDADLALEVRDAGAVAAHAPPVPIHVALFAPPRAQMNIAGSAGTFGSGTTITSVDFGVLGGTTTRLVFLQVRSNTAARLTIVSANRGKLLRSGGLSIEPGIPYTAEFDGQAVDLAKRWQGEIVSVPTLAGASLPFRLKVRADPAHVAGAYSDMLTLDLSAL